MNVRKPLFFALISLIVLASSVVAQDTIGTEGRAKLISAKESWSDEIAVSGETFSGYYYLNAGEQLEPEIVWVKSTKVVNGALCVMIKTRDGRYRGN